MVSAETKQFVDSRISGNRVTVFAKSGCPYCIKAIEALTKAGVAGLHIEEIERSRSMAEIQDYLLEKTGARSVPRVFIDGQFYGGGDDVVRGFETGAILGKLKAAGAL